MNMVKKIFSLCLALTLLLSLAVPAMAEDTVDHTNHTITINTSDLNRTYEAYQIFSGSVEFLDSDNDSATAPVKVLTHITWGNAVDYDAIVKDLNILQALQSPTRNPKSYQIYTSIQPVGTVEGKVRTWNDVAADIADALGKSNSEANGIHFSDIVGDYLINTNGIESGKVTVDGVEKLQIGPLSDGYYLVRDTTSLADSNEVRSLFMMQLVENSTATPKPSTVEIKKYIVNGDERVPYLAKSSGNVVEFVLRGTVPTRIYSYPSFYYAIEDTMADGFDLVQGTIRVFVYNGASNKEILGADLDSETGLCKITTNDDNKGFKVEFPDLKKLEESKNYTLQGSSYIVVTYQAKLNKSAIVGSTGNENEVLLRFSDGPHSDTKRTTNEEYVDVFTFGLNIEKIDGSNSKKLQGAEFVLYRERGGQHEHALIKDGWVYEWTADEYDTLKASLETQKDDTEKQKLQEKLNAMTLTSGENGLVTVKGLAEDTYYLREIKAPYGYQLLKAPYQFQIVAEYALNMPNNTAENAVDRVKLSKLDLIPAGGTRVSGDVDTGMVNVSIVNNPGHTLPETGGIGTTIFYVVGGILAAGALVLLITRKRMYE